MEKKIEISKDECAFLLKIFGSLTFNLDGMEDAKMAENLRNKLLEE